MATATTNALDLRADLMKPFERQIMALDAIYTHDYVLYGGAAGPGKSYWLRWAALEYLLELAAAGHHGVRVGLFCEDYPSLRDRQISRMTREFPLWLGELKETRDEGLGFHLHPRYGGGYIALRNLDDPAKYASTEFAAEFVDELTKNDRQTFDDLRFRLRWPGVQHTPFVAASNPGSIGHGWVKKLWVDRDFTGDDDVFDPDRWAFIRALPRDNPYLSASYWAQLDSLPEAMRAALRDGSWDMFAGKVFTEWSRDAHIIEPFPIPASWLRWVAIDYGYSAPFCALWFAKSPPDCLCYGPDKHDHIYIYRELYESGLRAQEQAQRIQLASQGEDIRLYAADPSMWAKREGVQGDSLAEEYIAAGIHVTKANNDRLAGLNAFHEALAVDKDQHGRVIGLPRLRSFSTCRNFNRTLPDLPYDKHRPEDVDTKAEDHPYDAGRYGLLALDGVWEAVPEVNLQVSGWALNRR